MTSRDFCYWLQGYFEINGVSTGAIDRDSAECIRNHLSMVFHHEIDPSHGDAKHHAELSALHEGVKKAQETADAAKKAADAPRFDPMNVKINC